MKHVKKKVNKVRLTLILSSIFVALLAVSIVLGVLLLDDDTPAQEETPPEILEGESLHYNMAIAYPAIEETDIQTISVKNKNGAYDLIRSDGNGDMVLYYTDTNGKKQIYYPNILEEEKMDYSSLYSIEMNDSYKRIFKLTYLCIALEIPYFEERILLSENEAEREAELREYGLSGDGVSTVVFSYKDANGELQAHSLTIGAKNINGNGYYFMVDGRPRVYTSQNNYYDYALAGFESFVKATLVASGLSVDNGQEPFLTTDFHQWVNEKHDSGKVTADSTVIVYADELVPKNGSDDSGVYGDGYFRTGYSKKEFDLNKYKNETRFLNALVGQSVGKPAEPITVSLTSRYNAVDLSKSDSKKYSYSINKIESIIGENGEIYNTGIAVGNNNLIKARYDLYIDGKREGTGYYGIFDLGEAVWNSANVAILRTKSIGEIEPVSLNVDYTKDNSVKINFKHVITEIVAIQNKEGNNLNRVTEQAVVSYKFKIMMNGTLSESEEVAVIDFTDNSESNASVYEKLKGETVGKNKNIVTDDYDAYCQYVYDFIAYEIKEINYFITSKLVSAFKFQNGSKRDPYYGESLYENLMEDENRLYGLDSGACESVVQILGGIAGESGSNEASGFYGEETLAIGITPQIKEDFDLYGYTVYFELPRQIYVTDGSYSDSLDDYDSAYRLGFTLYISEEKTDTETGKRYRYVGSDMYDVVTKIDAEKLDFLNYGFINYWARRDMIMMDIKNIENIGVEFLMSDIYGAYDFKLIHENVKLPTGTDFDKIIVSTTVIGENSGNLFTDYVKSRNYTDNNASLTEFYKHVLGDAIAEHDKESAPDSTGTAEFKRLVRMIYFTGYTNILTKEEQEEILRDGKLLMKMSLKITDNVYNQGNRYVYEFYRNDDRRVMVRIYQADSEGNAKTAPVSDFYISTFAFKKLVRNFNDLLNGKILDTDKGYAD